MVRCAAQGWLCWQYVRTPLAAESSDVVLSHSYQAATLPCPLGLPVVTVTASSRARSCEEGGPYLLCCARHQAHTNRLLWLGGLSSPCRAVHVSYLWQCRQERCTEASRTTVRCDAAQLESSAFDGLHQSLPRI